MRILRSTGPFTLLIGLGIVSFASGVQAQGCCAPGTSPLGSLGGPDLAPGQINAGVTFEYYELDQTYEGRSKVTDRTDRYSRVRRAVPWLRVGLPLESSLVVEWPHEDRFKELRAPDGSALDIENQAPGDLSTLILVRAVPRSSVARWSLNVGAGVKWPTGPSERAGIPVEVQSGTGATDLLVAITTNRHGSTIGVTAQAIGRFPGRGENLYEYGNVGDLNVSLFAAPRSAWTAGADLRLRAAAFDHFADRKLPNTGGTRLLAGPRLAGTWRKAGLSLEVAYLVPVFEQVHGIQLGVGRQVALGVRWGS
jgi:hypothetical protein